LVSAKHTLPDESTVRVTDAAVADGRDGRSLRPRCTAAAYFSTACRRACVAISTPRCHSCTSPPSHGAAVYARAALRADGRIVIAELHLSRDDGLSGDALRSLPFPRIDAALNGPGLVEAVKASIARPARRGALPAFGDLVPDPPP
jgi:hypothetical protein